MKTINVTNDQKKRFDVLVKNGKGIVTASQIFDRMLIEYSQPLLLRKGPTRIRPKILYGTTEEPITNIGIIPSDTIEMIRDWPMPGKVNYIKPPRLNTILQNLISKLRI